MPNLAALDRAERERLAVLFAEREKRQRQRVFHQIFPDETARARDGAVVTIPCAGAPDGVGLWARGLYPKHLEFFRAGAIYRERAAICANRIGKTLGIGAYESTAHLTGIYPAWWEGKRFDRPVRGWAAGKTNETTRDIVQCVLLGDIEGGGATKRLSGTGVVPGRLLGRPTWKQGVPDLVDGIKVKHVSGGWSTLGLKSYQQGRGSFEGTSQDFVWFDEEPPEDVYGEALIRTTTTGGLIYMTFTPLEGVSLVVLQFLPANQRPMTDDLVEQLSR